MHLAAKFYETTAVPPMASGLGMPRSGPRAVKSLVETGRGFRLEVQEASGLETAESGMPDARIGSPSLAERC